MRNLIVFIILFAGIIFASDIPEKIELYSSNKSHMQRKAILFNHSKHMKGNMGCLDCHHDYEKGQQIMTGERLLKKYKVKCESCHIKGKDLRDRYHKLCQGCHREYIKYDLKTGPLQCGLCHKR